MAPGIAVKSVLQGSFSLMVFDLLQIVWIFSRYF
jgi:hypothetical protein